LTDPASWNRIEAILDELLDLPSDERAARLDGLAGADAALRPHVERLLRADSDETGGILDRGIAPLAQRVMDDERAPASAASGTRIGPYRVVRELGRGGMGEVLLAERADGEFEQLVALKIIRGGMNRAEIVERFRHERRILARLRHPNIAALYDGGATDDGTPYFAMEYVEGRQIHDDCDARRLSVDERIDLFDFVCRAVGHAHRNLVVHRDLKPSNVLVTPEGTVKLLDFGIAKVVDAEAGESESAQRTSGFLTPAYAAPEQILGEPTSTATDVYALGVLLYLLLTGHNPHGETTRSIELARAILEGETPDPSAAAGRGTQTETSEEIARRRGTEPAGLRRRMRGDLDNILRKALQKKPDERYASVEDLRADLERHRRSLPVAAREPTAGYRIRKFVRRHRIGVAAGSAVAIALVAGVLGIAWQADVAMKARTVAERARDESDAVTRFLSDMLGALDPRKLGREVTVREVLDEGARTIGTEFPEQPLVQSRLMISMGTAYSELGHYEQARPLLEQALAIQEEALGPDDPRVAQSLNALGSMLRLAGEYAGARAHLERAIAIQERALGPAHPDVAHSVHNLASVLWKSGEPAEARACWERAIAIREKALQPDHPDVARSLTGLGILSFEAGDYAAARAAHERAMTITEKTLGAEHPDVALGLNNLANVAWATRDYEGARRLYERALAIRERAFGPDHPEVSSSVNNLAGLLHTMGDLEAARPLYERALAMRERALGENHPNVGQTASNLALLLEATGNVAEARRLYERTIRIYETALGPTHADVARPLLGLGILLRDAGEPEQARALLERSLAIREGALGADHHLVSESLHELAVTLRRLGQGEKARPLFERALAIRTSRFGTDDPRIVETRDSLVVLLRHLGDDAAVQSVLRQPAPAL